MHGVTPAAIVVDTDTAMELGLPTYMLWVPAAASQTAATLGRAPLPAAATLLHIPASAAAAAVGRRSRRAECQPID